MQTFRNETSFSALHLWSPIWIWVPKTWNSASMRREGIASCALLCETTFIIISTRYLPFWRWGVHFSHINLCALFNKIRNLIRLQNEYTDWEKAIRNPLSSRDATLQFLSDGHTASPLIKLGYMHSLRGGRAYFLHFKHKTIEEEYPQVGRNAQAHLTALVMAMNMDPLENRLRARRRCAFLVGSAHVPALPTQLHDSGAPNRPTNAAISVQLCQDWVSL